MEFLVFEILDDYFVLMVMENNIIIGKLGKYVIINGKFCVNMVILNFFGMVGNLFVEVEVIKILKKYGVGLCGFRGFYGIMDVYLEFEDKIVKFMNCEEVILYVFGFAIIASVILVYSKRGDVIFVDEGVCFVI